MKRGKTWWLVAGILILLSSGASSGIILAGYLGGDVVVAEVSKVFV